MRTTPHDNYKYRALVGEAVDRWQAAWLTSERFRKAPYLHLSTHHGYPEQTTESHNIHTLYRKNFTAKDSAIVSAKLYITGDDIYKLYLNGTFVGEGPAQSYPFAFNYNCYDVSDLLRQGDTNAIGVHVFYQGHHNIYLMSADNAEGMIAQLRITYADGSGQLVCSDHSWFCKETEAWSCRYIFGYETALSEDIDLNKWEDGWLDADCDMTGWYHPQSVGFPYPARYHLVPQITPPVKHEIIRPAVIKPIENGFFVDFGKEVVGTIALRVKGNPGDVIEIRCAEELNDDGSVRYQMRCNCQYQEYITLTGGEDFVDFYDFKGYRYAEILGISELDPDNIWTLLRSYPYPDDTAVFETSDELMRKIWDLCFYGVKIGTQDTYLDCPTREKGGFIGDALVTGLSHLIFTGDLRVYKKFILDFAYSGRHHQGLICHVPTFSLSPFIDYSLLYPLFLEEYCNQTGDLDFIRELLPVGDAMIQFYRQFEREDGLLSAIVHADNPKTEPYVLDWPENYRDGYDYTASRSTVCTAINGLYYGSLKTFAKLYAAVGDGEKAAEYEALTARVGESLNEKCYDYETGLYRDTPTSKHAALHASVYPLFFGLVPPKGYEPVVKLLKEKRLACGVYFSYFYIGFLYRIGEYDFAYDLLSGTDEHSWANMLREGATACMEAWGKDQKWNTSWCHPWSSTPVGFYTRNLLGIQIDAPAMAAIKVAPHIPASLDHMKLDFPTPRGRICAGFVRENGRIRYSIRVPDGVEVRFEDPTGEIEFIKL